ncbi:MAG: DUF58 domain-containing protein [Candidatus Obscuribacterales bacterium]|nr:DUF58 domain-containing protein [Candidatus Obscuribacterales bacterium]
MPRLLNESWKQSLSQSENYAGGAALNLQKQLQSSLPGKADGSSIKLNIAGTSIAFELRFFILLFMILPLYLLASFVGNEWAYFLPCALLSALIVGVLLPLLELFSINAAYQIVQASSKHESPEIILSLSRRNCIPFFSGLLPSAYLNAKIYLLRRSWTSVKKDGFSLALPVVLPNASSGSDLTLPLLGLRRGIYELDCLEVSTCFPFALVWCFRKIPLREENRSFITILPALKEIQGNFHARLKLNPIKSSRSLKNWIQQNRSSSFKGLREFTERDSLNQIHWSSSARCGKFLVREYEFETLAEFDLLIDLRLPWNNEQLDLAAAAAYALLNYGQKIGFSSKLNLRPSAEWPQFAELLSNLPQGLSSLEYNAEVLARLTPLAPALYGELNEFEAEQRKKDSLLNPSVRDYSRALLSISPLSSAQSLRPAGIGFYELDSNFSEADSIQVLEKNHSARLIFSLDSEAELARI